MGKKHKVVHSAEEAQRAAIGDQMLDQGKRNFESVYGSKAVGSFDLNKDMTAMGSVKIMTPEQIKQNAQAGAIPDSTILEMPVSQPNVEMPQDKPTPQPDDTLQNLWMSETNEQIPFDEWVESKKVGNKEDELSEDPVKRAEQIAEFIKKTHPNAPTAQMLQSWRQMHGDIFMLNVADRIYIYRYLKRQEWIQINSNPKMNELTDMQIEEDMFKRCTLWPQLDMIQMAGMPAGAISMVVQQIRIQSLFLDPSYVAQLTVKI